MSHDYYHYTKVMWGKDISLSVLSIVKPLMW